MNMDWYDVGDPILLLRRWGPGDKDSCSFNTRRSFWPCGDPVVVTGYRRDLRDYTTLCLRHAVGFFEPNLGGAAPENNIDQQVRSQVIRNHWGEYQTLLDDRLADLLEERLSALPDWLKGDVSV